MAKLQKRDFNQGTNYEEKVLPAKHSWKMYIKNRLKINLNITATSASVNVTLANKASWLILPILGLW